MSSAGYGNHIPSGPADAKAPDAREAKPPADAEASPPPGERRDASTPGGGALPDGPEGDEVDPGVG